MNFFIGVVPPSVISAKIFDIQNKFGNNRLEPHITIQPPIALKDEEKWMNAIEEVCKRFSPFTVKLTGTGNFGKRVLFIEVQSQQLLTLERLLRDAVQPYEQEAVRKNEKDYHPHLTLGRSWCGFTKDDFTQMEILANEYLAKEQVSFIAESLRIYFKPKGNEGYKTFKDIALK